MWSTWHRVEGGRDVLCSLWLRMTTRENEPRSPPWPFTNKVHMFSWQGNTTHDGFIPWKQLVSSDIGNPPALWFMSRSCSVHGTRRALATNWDFFFLHCAVLKTKFSDARLLDQTLRHMTLWAKDRARVGKPVAAQMLMMISVLLCLGYHSVKYTVQFLLHGF